MTYSIAITISFICIFEFMVNLLFIIYIKNFDSLSLFNPINNYKTWTRFNWFGIAIITLLLNIVLIPYAIVYWIYKLLTVGRKEK